MNSTVTVLNHDGSVVYRPQTACLINKSLNDLALVQYVHLYIILNFYASNNYLPLT